MSGTLYLCATPIGNLEDMTFRVIETLKKVDVIAAEDTRNSVKLINHFQINTPMISYHEHNKLQRGPQLIEKLLAGQDIALITDAGTPAISDPGEELVVSCQEQGILVTSLPGASAVITGLSLSGLSTRRFSFEGFLPAEKKEQGQILQELKSETRTIIFYEAPHRLLKTQNILLETIGNRRVTICRELTKRFETVIPTTLEEGIAHFTSHTPKGEFVIIIAGKSQGERVKEEQKKWEMMNISQHMDFYLSQGYEKKTAMKAVAKDRGVSRRDIYQILESDKKNKQT